MLGAIHFDTCASVVVFTCNCKYKISIPKKIFFIVTTVVNKCAITDEMIDKKRISEHKRMEAMIFVIKITLKMILDLSFRASVILEITIINHDA